MIRFIDETPETTPRERALSEKALVRCGGARYRAEPLDPPNKLLLLDG